MPGLDSDDEDKDNFVYLRTWSLNKFQKKKQGMEEDKKRVYATRSLWEKKKTGNIEHIVKLEEAEHEARPVESKNVEHKKQSLSEKCGWQKKNKYAKKKMR